MTTTPAMPEHFTKKPVTVEAFQMTEARRMDNCDWPEWLNEAWNKAKGQPGALFRQNMDAPLPDLLCIQTLEGVHLVNWGDWIIRGVKGELYPCKPDIFEMTYDRATLQAQPAAEVSDAWDAALKALDAVAAWQLPQVPDSRTEEPGATVSYGLAYGSNGERDYMRSLAQTAAKRARAILALRPQAVPMTDEQIRATFRRCYTSDEAAEMGFPDDVASTRAVEEFHRIGITAPAGGEKQA